VVAATSLASSSESDDQNDRQLQVQEQKLPRWAQSVIGDSAFALKPPQQADDIEEVFKNTLEKVQEEQVVQKAVFYGIAEDEEESKQSQADLEDDAAIGEQILLRQRHQQYRLGLGDDDEDQAAGRHEDVTRHSMSQEFFQKKKEFQQRQVLNVEDIFGDTLVSDTVVLFEDSQPIMASAPQPCKKASPLELSAESLVELQTAIEEEKQPQLRIKEPEAPPDTTNLEISAAVKEELDKINESLSRITALLAAVS